MSSKVTSLDSCPELLGKERKIREQKIELRMKKDKKVWCAIDTHHTSGRERWVTHLGEREMGEEKTEFRVKFHEV